MGSQEYSGVEFWSRLTYNKKEDTWKDRTYISLLSDRVTLFEKDL